MTLTLINEQDTEQLGVELWRILPKKCVVFLKGDLGAGKTTLTRGVLRAAGHQGVVKSPTYNLVEEYNLATGMFFHFDFFRIKDPEELEWMGINDYLDQQSICFIEWPEMGAGYLPCPDLEISMITKEKERKVKISITSKKLQNTSVLKWKNNNIVL